MISRVLLSIATFVLLTGSACGGEAGSGGSVAMKASTGKVFAGPVGNDAAWRDLDPENTLNITTKYGIFVIEMAPEFAPKHVGQIKKLARQGFYDYLSFHRVIDGFMNQTGDPRGDGTGDSGLPDIPAEFTFRRSPKMSVTLVGRELTSEGEVDTGFYKAFPVATKPAVQSGLTKDGKVEAWGLHCPGTASMARGGHDVNSANSQFFLMRAGYPSLNRLYSIWGRTVWGNEGLTRIKVGTKGETRGFVPDKMEKVQVLADVPESDRINVQVMRTDSAVFKKHIESLTSSTGKYPKVCDIPIPSRLKP